MKIDCGDLAIEGASRAGEETWFKVRPPGLAFDVGRGPLTLVGVDRIFLSHGHLDHAAGLPLLLSHRALHRLEPPTIHCPRPIAVALEGFLRAAARLEGEDWGWRLAPLEPGERVEVAADAAVEAFAADHPVPALGYHLFRRKRRLAARYRGLDQARLGELARQGEMLSETVEEHLLTYCGDTGPAVLESEPRLYAARVLLVECTFLAPGAGERGRDFGHLHLDDLVARRERFENRIVVLHHLSRRHRPSELLAAARQRMPELAPRIRVAGASDEPQESAEAR